MKQIKLVVFLISLTSALQAQKAVANEFSVIDRKMLQLPDSLTKTTQSISDYITSNFTTDKEKARAIFIWVTANIQYDIDNMFAIDFYESKENKITRPLKTRKGICENYAALFNDICSKSGIKSYVIEGYTKQNGFADYIPHAWCAAFIDSSWSMFDPTWGSGYVSNGKFYKKINNEYFKVRPSALIKSHMPFDFLWQFLNFPITNQEFYEGKTQQNKSKKFFNYIDSIKAYQRLTYTEQLMASSQRIEKNGVKNSLIFDRLQHIKLEIENDRQNRTVGLYNSAIADYNDGIKDFNAFIEYRNKQFTPGKSDAEVQQMIDSADIKLKKAKTKLTGIKNPDLNTVSSISKLNTSIDDIETHVQEQQDWLKLYFSKGKGKRKSMFYEKKFTWFEIPVN